VAFSLFGKKDEPAKKDESTAKKPSAPASVRQPGTGTARPPPVTPPAPKPVGGAKPTSNALASAPKAVLDREESVPVEDDDLDFTALVEPKAAPAPAAEKPAAPPAAKPAAPPAAPAAAAAKPAPAAAPKPAAAAPAPAAKAAPAAAPAAAPPAKPSAPPASADLAPLDPGDLATAKGGPAKIEKTWMPEGRSLTPEKAPAAKGAAPAEPARPRGSASAGPSAPPTLTPGKPAAPAAADTKPAAPAADAPAAAKPAAAPAAPPKPAAAPAPAAAAAPPAPKPQPAPVAASAAAPAPAAAPPEPAEPDLTLPAPLEQAAVMFANGQAEAAVKALKAAIAAGNLGDFAAQAWLMLFDLYQAQGRKEQHEELALEFVVKFERSAPAWREEPKEAAKDAASSRGMGSYFAFTGELTNASTAEFEQLSKVSAKGSLLRIDFGKLKGIDAGGAEFLLEVLKSLGKANRELVLTSHTNLVNLITSHLEVGNKDNPQVFWMLLLELYQILGLQTEFDDAALNFAITYEVSPPSFEAKAKVAKVETASPEPSASGDDAIVLAGELCGSDDDELARLAKSAALHQHVLIDMAQVKRVDFVAAGAILNIVTALAGAKKQVQFRATNELVAALFQVVGITRSAKLIRRR
jgi:anti-anti-sigma regulatory factor